MEAAREEQYFRKLVIALLGFDFHIIIVALSIVLDTQSMDFLFCRL